MQIKTVINSFRPRFGRYSILYTIITMFGYDLHVSLLMFTSSHRTKVHPVVFHIVRDFYNILQNALEDVYFTYVTESVFTINDTVSSLMYSICNICFVTSTCQDIQ